MSELTDQLKATYVHLNRNRVATTWEEGYLKAVEDVIAYFHDGGYTWPAGALEREVEMAKKPEAVKCECGDERLATPDAVIQVSRWGCPGTQEEKHSRIKCERIATA